jgi:hypothetical protein
MVRIPAAQTVLDPVEDVVTAEEHPGLSDRRSGNVGIDQLTHGTHAALPCKPSRFSFLYYYFKRYQWNYKQVKTHYLFWLSRF